MKTLGQVAYEAHTPDYRVQWDDLWLGHRKAWQAAAEAVAKHIQKGFILNSPEEDAVIEAAKALFNGYTAEDSCQDYWKNDAVLDHRLYALFLKVEALQEVEGG